MYKKQKLLLIVTGMLALNMLLAKFYFSATYVENDFVINYLYFIDNKMGYLSTTTFAMFHTTLLLLLYRFIKDDNYISITRYSSRSAFFYKIIVNEMMASALLYAIVITSAYVVTVIIGNGLKIFMVFSGFKLAIVMFGSLLIWLYILVVLYNIVNNFINKNIISLIIVIIFVILNDILSNEAISFSNLMPNYVQLFLTNNYLFVVLINYGIGLIIALILTIIQYKQYQKINLLGGYNE